MGKIEEYYKKTENSKPSFFLENFINNVNLEQKNAVDLGCGAGRNTLYLIKNGFKVLAIDKEDTSELIAKKLNSEELKRFKFRCQNFKDIEIDKNNLLVANFSIPFCNKNYFKTLWNKITNNILENGYFVGNFLGLNDSWAKTKKDMVFLSKEEVLDLFKDNFDIIFFKEVEKDEKTALGVMKHWHIYNVIAKKNLSKKVNKEQENGAMVKMGNGNTKFSTSGTCIYR